MHAEDFRIQPGIFWHILLVFKNSILLDGGGVPQTSNENVNVVEDVVMPNMEDNEDTDSEDDEEEEEERVRLVASSAEESESDNLPENESGEASGRKPGGPVDLSQDPAEGPRHPQLRSYPTRSLIALYSIYTHGWNTRSQLMLLSTMHVDIFSTTDPVILKRASPILCHN